MSWWEGSSLDRARWGEVAEPLLSRLERARDRDLFPQALLLAGPPGLGRELVAVEASVLLVCQPPSGRWAEDGCADRVRRGVHPDVVALRPEPPSLQIKIEQIRGVVEAAAGRPFEGRARVWILDGVESDRLGASAANAFLKVLEVPPEHVRFLLLAANPAAVLPTIRSRCQVLALPGAMAIADLAPEGLPPELAGAQAAGLQLEDIVRNASGALRAGLEGDLRPLLRIPFAAEEEVPLFEVMAAAAVEVADSRESPEEESDLLRLAGELLATEQRCRALNLRKDRQLVGCLVRWWREVHG